MNVVYYYCEGILEWVELLEAFRSHTKACKTIPGKWHCDRELFLKTKSRKRLKCDGTLAEIRFRLSAKKTSPFKSAGALVQSTTGSRGVRISSSNAGYTMFRGSVKSTGYPLHSPVSSSLPLPCISVCHHASTGLYRQVKLVLIRIETRSTSVLPVAFLRISDIVSFLLNSYENKRMDQQYLILMYMSMCRSQWSRGLRHRSAATRLLRSRVRIPPGAWSVMSVVYCQVEFSATN